MLCAILHRNFATNSQAYWDALPGEEVIDHRRNRTILKLKALRNVAPALDKSNSDELSAVCCFKLLRSNRGTRVEVTPNDVQWSYLARRRGDNVYVIVGDASIWLAEDLPDRYELEDE